MSMRALVVDDTAIFRRIVSDALAGLPEVEVVGTASNGRQAMARMAALRPDLVTLDIEMPEMNGIEVLEAMGPAGLDCGVVVLSAVTVRGGQMTVRALELGAFDFLTKPERGSPAENMARLRELLLPMVRAFERQREVRKMLRGGPLRPAVRPAASLAASGPERVVRRALRAAPPMVLIGVSTGGPAALARLLPGLPADLGAPVLIVQHMPPLFTQPLAASLDRKCAIRVKEAAEGEPARPNCAYVAPGGRHMRVAPGPAGAPILHLTDDPPENGCRPSADYLFRSVAAEFPGRSVAAILTGMGNDGAQGLRWLKRGGCFAVAQDEASCVVFGMPKEAIALGVVDSVMALDSIAGAIVRAVRDGTP